MRLEAPMRQAVNRTIHSGETRWFHYIRISVSFTEFSNSCLAFSLDRGLQVLLEKAHSIAKQSCLRVDTGSSVGGCMVIPPPTHGEFTVLFNRILHEEQKENICSLLFLNLLNC